MTEDAKRVIELRELFTKLQQKADREFGQRQQLMKQLKKEFNAENLEEANNKLEHERDRELDYRNKLAKQMREFDDKWGDKLGLEE